MFGGTATQTLVLSIITIQCDWEKEVTCLVFLFFSEVLMLLTFIYLILIQAEIAKMRITKWADPKQELN